MKQCITNWLVEARVSTRELLNCVRRTDGHIRSARQLSLAQLEERVMLSASPAAVVLPVDVVETHDVAYAHSASSDSTAAIASESAGLAIHGTKAEEIPSYSVLLGSESDDILDRSRGRDLIIGGDGDDIIEDSWGNDIHIGGEGADIIDDSWGSDVLILGGDDIADAGWGDDRFLFSDAQVGDVIFVDGSNDTDTIDLSEFGAENIEKLATGNMIQVNVEGGSFTIFHDSVEKFIFSSADGDTTPQAIAAEDQNVSKGQQVTLSAADSFDAEGSELAYSWIQIQGETVVLENATTAEAGFTAPDVSDKLVFAVIVSDGNTSDVSFATVFVDYQEPVAEESATGGQQNGESESTGEQSDPLTSGDGSEVELRYLNQGVEYDALAFDDAGAYSNNWKNNGFATFHADGSRSEKLTVPPNLWQVVIDDDGQKGYGIKSGIPVGLVEFTVGETESTAIAGPAPWWFAQYSGVGLDTANNRFIMTAADVNALFAYDLEDQLWTELADLGGVSLTALTYDSQSNSIIGLSSDSANGVTLHEFDTNGNMIRETHLAGIPTNAMVDDGSRVQLVATDDYIVIATPANETTFGRPNVEKAYAFDRETRELFVAPQGTVPEHEHIQPGVTFNALQFEVNDIGELVAADQVRFGGDGLSDHLQTVPSTVRQVVFDSATDTGYGISVDDQVVVFQAGDATTSVIELSAELPAMGDFNGITLDGESLLVTTNQDEGFLYRYTFDDQQWTVVRSLNNLNLQAITNSYYGVLGLATHATGDTILYQLGFDGSVSLGDRYRFDEIDLGVGSGNSSRVQFGTGLNGDLVFVTQPTVVNGRVQQAVHTYNTSSGARQKFDLAEWHDASEEPEQQHPEFTAVSRYVDDDGRSTYAWTDFASDGSRLRLVGVPAVELAYDESRQTFYSFSNYQINATQIGGATTSIPLSAEAANAGWMTGVAYDSTRDRVVLSSLSGVGHLYAYDLTSQQWSTLASANNVDLSEMTYHAASDSLFGLTSSYSTGNYSLIQYDAGTGATIATHSLNGLDAGFAIGGSPYQLASSGDYVILLKTDSDGQTRIQEYNVSTRQLQRGPDVDNGSVQIVRSSVDITHVDATDVIEGLNLESTSADATAANDWWQLERQQTFVDGGDGNDVIHGASYVSTILGGDGDDILGGGSGSDVIVGGDGNDTIIGGSGNDFLLGGEGVNTIFGGRGLNTLFGGSDADTLIGHEHGDTNVMLTGGGNDVVKTGGGDTHILVTNAQAGDVITIRGGDGTDTIDVSNYSDVRLIDDGTIEVTVADGVFTIVHTNVESIRESDNDVINLVLSSTTNADGQTQVVATTDLIDDDEVSVQWTRISETGTVWTGDTIQIEPSAISREMMYMVTAKSNIGSAVEFVVIQTEALDPEIVNRFDVATESTRVHSNPDHQSELPVVELLDELPDDAIHFRALTFGATNEGSRLVEYGIDGLHSDVVNIPDGVVQIASTAVRSDRPFYGLTSDGQLVVIDGDRVEPVDIPDTIAALGTFDAIAALGESLVLAVNDGVGHLVRYDAGSQQWSIQSTLNGADISALIYDNSSGIVGVGVHPDGVVAMYEFESYGHLQNAPIRLVSIPVDHLLNSPDRVQLVLDAGKLFVITESQDGQQYLSVADSGYGDDSQQPAAYNLSAWQDAPQGTNPFGFYNVVWLDGRSLTHVDVDGAHQEIAKLPNTVKDIAVDSQANVVYQYEVITDKTFDEEQQDWIRSTQRLITALDLSTGQVDLVADLKDLGTSYYHHWTKVTFDGFHNRLLVTFDSGMIALDLEDGSVSELPLRGGNRSFEVDSQTGSIYELTNRQDRSTGLQEFVLTVFDSTGQYQQAIEVSGVVGDPGYGNISFVVSDGVAVFSLAGRDDALPMMNTIDLATGIASRGAELQDLVLLPTADESEPAEVDAVADDVELENFEMDVVESDDADSEVVELEETISEEIANTLVGGLEVENSGGAFLIPPQQSIVNAPASFAQQNRSVLPEHSDEQQANDAVAQAADTLETLLLAIESDTQQSPPVHDASFTSIQVDALPEVSSETVEADPTIEEIYEDQQVVDEVQPNEDVADEVQRAAAVHQDEQQVQAAAEDSTKVAQTTSTPRAVTAASANAKADRKA